MLLSLNINFAIIIITVILLLLLPLLLIIIIFITIIVILFTIIKGMQCFLAAPPSSTWEADQTSQKQVTVRTAGLLGLLSETAK